MLLQNPVNHVGLVLDRSVSMSHLQNQVVKVADGLVSYLARRSQEMDQETRVTIYDFGDDVQCDVFDMDVLRLPTISALYKIKGNTALVDATMQCINDLKLTPEKYNEHAFLIYVLTDGQENRSRTRPTTLQSTIASLPDHWTLGAFVPDALGVADAKRYGFLKDNISVWDTTNIGGIAEVEKVIHASVDQFMVNRTKGIRGTTSLFALNTVSGNDILRKLTPLSKSLYSVYAVWQPKVRVDEFCTIQQGKFSLGTAYYELMKPEKIQPQKQIAIMYHGSIYVGNTRQLLGLPDYEVKVNPDSYKDYKIFVQSTAPNRNLIGGTQVLVLNNPIGPVTPTWSA